MLLCSWSKIKQVFIIAKVTKAKVILDDNCRNLPTAMHTDTPYTLTQLSELIKGALHAKMPGALWIRTEIHRLNIYAGTGHCYLELVDKDQGRILSKLNATIWNTTFERLRAHFFKVTGTQLAQGMEVLLQVQVRFHELYGFSLNVVNIDASYSLGAMAKMRRETIRRLKEESRFFQNKSLSLPILPTRVAVISASGSKGYRDFANKMMEFVERYHFRIQIQLFEALLDGDNAIRTIPGRLRQISDSGAFDLVCIIRGGGGEVGISAFDHYDIAAAICDAPIPVISGIGHSTNETVSELVSNRMCITPTDVGNLIGQQFLEALTNLDELYRTVERDSRDLLFDEIQLLDRVTDGFWKASKNRLLLEKAALRELGVRLALLPAGTLKKARQEVETLPQLLENLIKRNLNQRHDLLNLLGMNMERALDYSQQKHHQQLQTLTEKVSLLDPLRILQRGYSITKFNGNTITDIKSLRSGDLLETTLVNGKVISQVIQDKNE
jgi:exodeoxyribonuclease VII large subunit